MSAKINTHVSNILNSLKEFYQNHSIEDDYLFLKHKIDKTKSVCKRDFHILLLSCKNKVTRKASKSFKLHKTREINTVKKKPLRNVVTQVKDDDDIFCEMNVSNMSFSYFDLIHNETEEKAQRNGDSNILDQVVGTSPSFKDTKTKSIGLFNRERNVSRTRNRLKEIRLRLKDIISHQNNN